MDLRSPGQGGGAGGGPAPPQPQRRGGGGGPVTRCFLSCWLILQLAEGGQETGPPCLRCPGPALLGPSWWNCGQGHGITWRQGRGLGQEPRPEGGQAGIRTSSNGHMCNPWKILFSLVNHVLNWEENSLDS